MTRDATTLDLDAIAVFGDGVVREARHAEAIASLGGSPVPGLLDSVHALQAVLLSADPKALRRRVGWIGRLLGRDLVLEAEGRAFRERLRVLVLDADARLVAFARFDEAIALAGHDPQQMASANDNLTRALVPMLPLVQALLEQDGALRAARDDGDALHAAGRALDSANALLAGYSPTHPATPEHAP